MISLTRRMPRTPLLPAEAWLVAGLLSAVALAIAALYTHPALFVAAAAIALAAGVAFYEPRAIGPLLALALPFEISKLAFPFLTTRIELGGGLAPTSIVDAGRLIVALASAVWLIRPGRARLDVVPSSPMTLPLALLLCVYALSTFYAADVAAARIESLRLLFSLGMFALLPFFVRDRVSLHWTLLALVLTTVALALVGIFQEVTGGFLWNEGLGLYGERRINTTFADPNHFARFLLEGIIVALVLWFFVERRLKFAFLLPAMALAILTLEFTGSRGSWLVGIVALPVTVALLPIARSLRVRMLGMGVALLVIAALALALFNPYFSKRVDTFKFGFAAAGARPYLVEAGLQMFVDHPLAGVGAGGYQRAFQDDYYDYKDPNIHANVTLSHTSIVTLLAELGIVGTVGLAFVAARWLLYVRSTVRYARGDLRAISIGLAMITVVIFLASQTEGRFLEDPYLWLAAGLLVAVDAISLRERESDPAADDGGT